MIGPRLKSGLLELSRLMIGETEPWWIIGSTALVLSGIESVEPDDIDVVASGDCVRRLLSRLGIRPEAAEPHGRFRSDPYQRIHVAGSTPIEVMGDLAVAGHDGFRPLRIQGRKSALVDGNLLFIPPVREQVDIFRMFGRDKDLAKADLLLRHFP